MRWRRAKGSNASVLGDYAVFEKTYEYRPPRKGERLTTGQIVLYMKVERNAGVQMHTEGNCVHPH